MRGFAWLCGVLLLGSGPATAAKIYKSTDAQGNVIYSDTPKPGAVEIEIPTEPAGIAPPELSVEPAPRAEERPAYRALAILAPANDAVVEYSGGWVNVFLTLEPALRVDRGDLVRLRLDGALLHSGTAATTISIPNVERGNHVLQAEIVDRSGQVLIVSAPVSFYQEQPFVQRWLNHELPQAYPPVYPPQHPPRADSKRQGDRRDERITTPRDQPQGSSSFRER